MKTRIIVWSLVAIIVIAGLVFIFSPRSRPVPVRTVTIETIRADAVQSLRQVERLEKKLARAVPNAPGAVEAGQLLADVRARLGQISSATELGPAEASLREAKQLLRRARRQVEVAVKGRPAPTGL